MPQIIDTAEVKGEKKNTPPADSGQRFSITSVFLVVVNLSNLYISQLSRVWLTYEPFLIHPLFSTDISS